MSTKGRIYVADGPWLLHRSFFTLRTKRPVEEALPYSFLSLLCKDAIAARATHMLIAFDGPRSFRYEVYDGYKSERKEKKGTGPVVDAQYTQPTGDPYDYLPQIYQMLSVAQIAYFQPRKHEADDVLRSVSHAYADDYSIVCGSQDKDGYQFLRGKRVRMYDSSHKGKDGKPLPLMIDENWLMRKHGLTPAQFLQYQILLGDKIDSIPRIGGLMPLQIKNALIEHGTIADWYKNDPSIQKVLDKNRVNIKRNRKLVTLCTGILPPSEPHEWKPPKLKHEDAAALPETYHAWHSTLYPKSRGLFV